MQAKPQASLVLTPLRQALPAAGGTLDVLVRVQAPDRPTHEGSAAQRQPLRLAIVVDRSGSMAGQPLQEALRCAEYIAARMQSTDQLAVLLYDNKVRTPVPLGPAGNGEAVRAVLASVDSGGSTALFDGWERGARQLEAGDRQAISRVLLLSDGEANEGLCDPAEIEKHCAQWATKGVSTTTVGLGRDFNEDLMIRMARAGGGQHYYGQTAEDLHDGFDEELALLQSLFLRKLRVKLLPGRGVIAEPLGVVHKSGDEWHQLPDLAWGAEAWMLVRLHLAAVNDDCDPRKLDTVLAVIADGEGSDALADLSAMLTLPRLAEADLQGLPLDETVARRLQEIEFSVATAKVHELARSGDMHGAKQLLGRLEAQVADHPWLAAKLAALRELSERDAPMARKELRYSMNRTSNRLAARDEGMYLASETARIDIPAFLRRKPSEGQGRKKLGGSEADGQNAV